MLKSKSVLELENLAKDLWNKYSFNVDVPVIDLQHIWLIFSILKLQQSIKIKAAPASIHKDVSFLLDYLIEHFKTEEKLLGMIQFPQFDSHCRKHLKYMEQLKVLHNPEFNSGSIYKTSEEILHILQNWIFEHLRKDDQKYGDYLLELGEQADYLGYNKKLLEEFTINTSQQILYQTITNDSTTFEIKFEPKVVQMIKEIWYKNNLATDIPIIDAQHMWLIKIFVELDISAKKVGIAKRKEVFLNTLMSSYEYVSYHFKTEELIMKNFQFPQYNSHVQQHREFVEFLRLRNEENKSKDSMATYNLLQDLRTWIYSHIAIEDKELKTFLKDRVNDVNLLVKQLNTKGEIPFNTNYFNLYRQIK